ncbi:glycosyl transferase [Rhodobacterales bacterium 52_120_T64]|nr:glycosyl transferase [Rhodobacterales bacterium 52_120_T64]
MSETSLPSIAVLLPCFNEEHAIASVVQGFKKSVPSATIYVYDNNSTDETCARAAESGAVVCTEPRQGKGNVIRRMFADIDADFYIMVDGDGTYEAADAPNLLTAAIDGHLDMVVGNRKDINVDAGRAGHAFGNTIFNFLFRRMFANGFSDIFSGYRVFSRRFVKSFPALSSGFEIETELSVHALVLKQPFTEIEVSYGTRMEGSVSKLNTFGDGFRISSMFVLFMKETRPFVFFSYLTGIAFLISAFFGLPVLIEYFQTGFVTLIPRWILSVGMLMVALVMFVCGLILDSVARGRTEHKRLSYLAIPRWINKH